MHAYFEQRVKLGQGAWTQTLKNKEKSEILVENVWCSLAIWCTVCLSYNVHRQSEVQYAWVGMFIDNLKYSMPELEWSNKPSFSKLSYKLVN